MVRTTREYNGDRCIVLPADYLETPQAAAELYADQAAKVVNNLYVPEFDQGLTIGRLLFRVGCLAVLLSLIAQ